jgi:predicted site-specific integrase-resolvase
MSKKIMVSPAEFAEMTSFAEDTIRKWVRAGKIRGYAVTPKAVRIVPEEGLADLKAMAKKGGEYETPETA